MAGFRDKLQRLIRPPDDEYEDVYDEDDEQDDRYDDEADEQPRKPIAFSGLSRSSDRDNRVVSLNAARNQNKVSVFRPVSFGEETRDIADALIQHHTVVLILERTEKETARRIVDFLSGVAYANRGNLKKVANGMFIVTPHNVDLAMEDVMSELDSTGTLYF